MKELEEISEEVIYSILSNTKNDDTIEYLQTDGKEEMEWLIKTVNNEIKKIYNLAIDKCIENAEVRKEWGDDEYRDECTYHVNTNKLKKLKL